jgi:hypothetical protein
MSIKIDTSNTEDLSRPKYEPLESGKYDLEITNKLEVKPSKNPSADGKNHGRIQVDFKDPDTGKTVTDYISLHPKMKWKLNQFGLSAGVLQKGESADIDLADFDGRVVTAIVGQRTWTKQDGSGETGVSNEIKEYIYE